LLSRRSWRIAVERTARNDSTCQWRGKTYEVPPHLRHRKVTLHYKLLRPERMWIEDGGTQIPLQEVDPVANSRRPRKRPRPKAAGPAPRTDLNSIEDLLGRTLRPNDVNDDEGEERSCAQS
jgi:hypothetical protein